MTFDRDGHPDRLTLEILAALAAGLTSAEAAARCHVSERSLRRRLNDARRVWGTSSTIETVAVAIRRGMV